ncbi:MAG TPA: hypothetical protein VF263_23080 [Longimicrobiaceae bacterium]
MMGGFLGMVGYGLVLTFIGCCVASAALQIVAWTRHAREGAPPTLRALTRPEEHFDAVGVQQIRLSRTLMTIGGVVYLSYGVLFLAARALQ